MCASDGSSTREETTPSTGDLTTPSRFDRATGVISGAPQTFGGLTLIRTTAKATLSHYRPGLLGADHQWKIGGQIEQGEDHGADDHSDRRAVRRQQRTAVSVHLERSLQRRRSVHHGRGVRERRHHGGEPADDQRRRALRPQPRHQSGPARARSRRARNRARSSAVSERCTPGTSWSPRLGVTAKLSCRRPNDAAGQLRAIQPGRADRRAQPTSIPARATGHDDRLRSGDRRLHAHRLGRRFRERTC